LLLSDPDGSEKRLTFDKLIVAVGRKANSTGFGLEKLGVELNGNGTVATDEYLRTNFPNIYAIGDVAGPYQFTHTASHMAWYASVNALFGVFKKFKVDYSVIPWATFCSPEVARVGLNEQEANEKGISYEVTTYDVADLDRAIADEEAQGLVKVLTVPGKDRILGVTIAADHAGELIGEFTLAMKHGIGLNKILGTIHIYPTFMEMNKFAASEWRKSHKPDWALDIAEKFHTWRRGGNPKGKTVSV
jgi:pyruvate/2-oxoglutarate dehydrogenase complex dihydrolipoamide dehydrogenase (E3) component